MSGSSRAMTVTEPCPSQLDHEQTLKASKALLAHIRKASALASASAIKNPLLEDTEQPSANTPIWLTLTTKKHIHNSTSLQPKKIAIPVSLNSDPESTICLMTADPQRAYKNMVASAEFPDVLRKRITRVVDLKHLKSKFKTFESQRKLCAEHDIFLGDDRIINQLPKALGKVFFKSTTKRPIPVVLMAARERVNGKRVARPRGKKERRDPAENVNARPVSEIVAEIENALHAALLNLTASTNTAIKIGYAEWKAEDLAANVNTVTAQVVARFVPQKWSNVRSIYIKGLETVSLPLWQTNELWVDGNQILANADDKVIGMDDAEKPNVGKKRKTLDAEVPRGEKSKRSKKALLPNSNDDKLDQEILERKANLKKQKLAAKVAVEA